MPPDTFWEKLAEVTRLIEPMLLRKLVYHQTNLPSPETQPVSNALARAFISRMERHLEAIRGGAEGMQREFGDKPGDRLKETLEIETWFIGKQKAIKTPEGALDAIGNFLVATGKSYAEARHMLNAVQRFTATKGAPSKRPETLKMMDARIAHRWSYKTLASKMCDCGGREHNEYCEERIRKRIKELESFLAKYKITYHPFTT